MGVIFMPVETHKPKLLTWRSAAIAAAAVSVAIGFEALTADSASAADTVELPSTVPTDEIPNLHPVSAEVQSAFVTGASFDRLAVSVDRSAHVIDELLRSLPHVADMNSIEVKDLLHDRAVLGQAQAALESIQSSNVLSTMKAQGFSPAHISHKANELARTIPVLNSAELGDSYKKLALMYNNLSYGEVLYTDSSGHTTKSLFADLLVVNGDTPDPTLDAVERLGRIPDKAAQTPPTLNHQVLSVVRTAGDPSKWFVPSAAFEVAADHTENSCHIAPINALQCVDLALVENKSDPLELGKLLLAAKGNPNVSFVQLEVGEHGSVTAMQKAIQTAWEGKIDAESISYLQSKVVQNGSGVHVHIKFNTPEFSKTFSMLK